MGKCLAIRMCAYGDAMYALPALEALSRKYGYLHLETGPRGKELFSDHPLIHKITTFDILKYKPEERVERAEIRWNALLDGNDWDLAVNFIESIEVSCIADEWQDEYKLPREHRRKLFGNKNFYDQHFIHAGLPVPDPFDCGKIYFSDGIIRWKDEWKERHGGQFVVAIALNGSTAQKYPMYMKELVQEIKSAYPEALFVLMGDHFGERMEFTLGDKSVLRTAGKWPYMQSLMLTHLADYVIGPETGLLVGAGLFGTPKSMICTSCSPAQATSRHKNDFSVQSTAPCSPCHRSAYHPKWCNYREHEFGMVPDCNFMVDFEGILEGVEFAYKVRSLRRDIERHQDYRQGVGSLPEMRPLLVPEPCWGEEVRPGVHGEVQLVRADSSGTGDFRVKMGTASTSFDQIPITDTGLGLWKWGVR